MNKQTQPLSEKRIISMDNTYCYPEVNIKQAIQKTLKDLKEELCVVYAEDTAKLVAFKYTIPEILDTTFKQNFGDLAE